MSPKLKATDVCECGHTRDEHEQTGNFYGPCSNKRCVCRQFWRR